MFVPLDAPADPLRPQYSHIAPRDWAILSDFWYAVARAEDIGEAPFKALLLDVELVLYRGEDRAICVALDRCPHRHVRVSSGQVLNGQIECPFHGLRFDGTGQCSMVPALGRSAKLPASYRLQTFPMIERYGLVWTCIGDATRHSIPSLPEFDGLDPTDITFGPVSDWPMSAPRQIENFFDLAHLPFVHAKTLGGVKDRALKPGRIEQANDGIIQHAEYVETGADGAKSRACIATAWCCRSRSTSRLLIPTIPRKGSFPATSPRRSARTPAASSSCTGSKAGGCPARRWSTCWKW